MLNPKNTFNSFVVGSQNDFAYAAAKAIAAGPGKSYNPFFISGGYRSGKTHLLHAIAQDVFSKNKGAQVACLTAEEFTNEYVKAIQNNKLVAFREKYLQNDLLLIDEVEFLAGKTRIQEEFYHTFARLHEAHKQIVLAGNCSREEVREIESSLVSRFEWGLVTETTHPDIVPRMTFS